MLLFMFGDRVDIEMVFKYIVEEKCGLVLLDDFCFDDFFGCFCFVNGGCFGKIIEIV